MTWDHEKTTIDGTKIFVPGTLVKIDLRSHMLIDDETPIANPANWLETSSFIMEYGTHPVVMVIDLDCNENYYRISLGEKYFWFPLIYTDQAA